MKSASKEKGTAEKRSANSQKAEKDKGKNNLLSATDSAINRLEKMTRPGGEIDTMDIKDLKNLISSIKELTAVKTELQEENGAGGVVFLPEVKTGE